jgi:hypothetical protein
MPSTCRVFLLSPANCSGKRAGYLLAKNGRSPLAIRLRSADGATIGEVFAFMSGLYFRGKLRYAERFANPADSCPAVQVIVPGLGLRSPAEIIDLKGLRAIAKVPVDPENRRYTGPLRRDLGLLADRMPPEHMAILLGSIATPKYLPALKESLGPRLRFPREFIGLGDMSRGALMLRCAAEGQELTYVDRTTPAEAR